MVLTFKQVNYQEIRRLSFIATKIIVGILILIYFGTSLVVCNDISFCDKRLKELREDEKVWSKRCLDGKGQNRVTPCCKAEKVYNHERMCVHTKMCFYKGLYAEPYLLIRSKSEIHAIDLTTLNTTAIIGGLAAGRAMDIDTVNNKLYITDSNSISRVNFDDICVEVILQNVNVDDMAIVWIHRLIFYTEYLKKQIFEANLDGKGKRVLINTISYPSSIAVDPVVGYLFWTEPVAKFVRRVNFAVTWIGETTLVNRKLSEISSIAVDCGNKRVYWLENEIQSGVDHIFSSDYDGEDQKTITSGSFNNYLMGVLGDSLYFLNNDPFYINEMNVRNGNISRNILVDKNSHYYDLIVVHSFLQPMDNLQVKSEVEKYLQNIQYRLDIKLREDSSDPSGGLNEMDYPEASKYGPTFTHQSESVDGPISISIGFEKDVLPSSTVQDLQSNLSYVALNKVPMPGFNYPYGWDIYPQTPFTRFKDGVTIVSYQNGRVHFKVDTRFFAVYGILRDVIVPPGASTPKYAIFEVRRDIRGLIDVNMPLVVLA